MSAIEVLIIVAVVIVLALGFSHAVLSAHIRSLEAKMLVELGKIKAAAQKAADIKLRGKIS